MAKQIMLEGAALCCPFVQGHLDYLCGLYAAVNATALVMAPTSPLTRAQARSLIRIGTEHLQKRDELCLALNLGIDIERQVQVALHMLKRAGSVTGVPILATTPFAGKAEPATITALERKLAEGAALMVFLQGALDHYSVICGMTRGRVVLFDSDGHHWLDRGSLCVGEDQRHARHYVPAASVIEVRAAAPE
jgi:hypothetical protein